jgi:hypothetical protein
MLKYEEPTACNLLPDRRRVDAGPVTPARAIDPSAVLVGSERWTSTDDDEDTRGDPVTAAATITLAPPPLVRRREVVAVGGGDSSVDIRGESVSLQEAICTAMRSRRRLSSECTERHAELLLASRP